MYNYFHRNSLELSHKIIHFNRSFIHVCKTCKTDYGWDMTSIYLKKFYYLYGEKFEAVLVTLSGKEVNYIASHLASVVLLKS